MAIAGYTTPEEMVGQTYEQVMHHQVPGERLQTSAENEAFLRHILSLDRSQPIRYQRRRATGEVFDVASDPTPGSALRQFAPT